MHLIQLKNEIKLIN